MSDDYLNTVAGELAELALADERRTGDINIVNEIGEIVGASSQTLQEAFLTAVRVRRAAKRARDMLTERATEAIIQDTRLIADQRDGEEEADSELDALRADFERPSRKGDDPSAEG